MGAKNFKLSELSKLCTLISSPLYGPLFDLFHFVVLFVVNSWVLSYKLTILSFPLCSSVPSIHLFLIWIKPYSKHLIAVIYSVWFNYEDRHHKSLYLSLFQSKKRPMSESTQSCQAGLLVPPQNKTAFFRFLWNLVKLKCHLTTAHQQNLACLISLT